MDWRLTGICSLCKNFEMFGNTDTLISRGFEDKEEAREKKIMVVVDGKKLRTLYIKKRNLGDN